MAMPRAAYSNRLSDTGARADSNTIGVRLSLSQQNWRQSVEGQLHLAYMTTFIVIVIAGVTVHT